MYDSYIRMNHVSSIHGLSSRLKQKTMNKSIFEWSTLFSRKFYVSSKSQP